LPPWSASTALAGSDLKEFGMSSSSANEPGTRPPPGDEPPWPVITIPEPKPSFTRRRWRDLEHEDRYRIQHEALLEITRNLAERNGFAGTQISQVVEAAGCSRRTFYAHFGSKEGCFGELIVRAGAQGIAQWVEAAKNSLQHGAYATMLAIIDSWAQFYFESPNFPLSPRLTWTLSAEAHRPGSLLAAPLDVVTSAGAEVFFVAARRLGSGLPDDALRVASRVQLSGLLDTIRPQPDGHVTPAKELLTTVLVHALGLSDYS
jgi:AcrR family transcriptional regulator